MRNIAKLVQCGIMAMVMSSVAAWTGTDGTYVMEGGGYSIEVRFGPGNITVVEPNKTSEYRQSGSPNEYLFSNPTNGIMYGLRVVDSSTLQAFKPEPGNVPTTLRLRRAPRLEEMPTANEAAAADAIASRYFALTESDPENLQTWTQCAAAALIRSMLPADQANESVLQAATLLKMMSVSRSASPCPDAIPQTIWIVAPSH